MTTLKNEFSDMTIPRDKLYGIYRGVVEDNNDPDQSGKCRIRVFGVHSPTKIKTVNDGIPTEELPWAEPVLGLIEGSISGYGFFGVPLQGSHVFVFFEAGNIMNIRYFATVPAIPTVAPDTTKGFNDPAGVYPESGKLSTPDWALGAGTYPHNVVLAVHCGHYVEIDSSPGNERIKVFHRTGTLTEIDKDGNIQVTGVKNETINITENVIRTVGGTDEETISGSQTNNVTGAVDETFSSTWNVTITGTATLACSSLFTITGSPLSLN